MKELIDKKTLKPNFGYFNSDLVEFNYENYVFKNMFDKKISNFRKKINFHAFQYISIVSNPYFLGIGIVDLGYIRNIFIYLFKNEEGLLYNKTEKYLISNRKIFDRYTPDLYKIETKKLKIEKSFDNKKILIELKDKKINLSFEGYYSLDDSNPLRLLSPAGQNGWCFTEKSPTIKTKSISLMLDNSLIMNNPEKTSVIYDWSAGYMKRYTEWYWGAFANSEYGFNGASFVNETLHNENGFWLKNSLNLLGKLNFDFEDSNPNKIWKIVDETNRVQLFFKPQKIITEKIDFLFVKTYFRQFLGEFYGEAFGKEIKPILGITEINRALW